MGFKTELIPSPFAAVMLSVAMLSENHMTVASEPAGIGYFPLAYPPKNVADVIWQSPTLLKACRSSSDWLSALRRICLACGDISGMVGHSRQ
jgi:hypothetical protein